MRKLNYDIDEARNGSLLRKVNKIVSPMARRQGKHHGYTDAIRDALDKIDLKQLKNSIAQEVNYIQSKARQQLMNGLPLRSKDMFNSDVFGKKFEQVGRQRIYNLWSKVFE